jgi:hypothetical protein
MIYFVNTALYALHLPSGQSSITGQVFPHRMTNTLAEQAPLLGIMHSNAVSFAARWKFHRRVWLA